MDFEFEAPSRFGPNRPLYKPEHWDKVQHWTCGRTRKILVMTCQPLGIPRQGSPRRIIQSANDIVFFYSQCRWRRRAGGIPDRADRWSQARRA